MPADILKGTRNIAICSNEIRNVDSARVVVRAVARDQSNRSLVGSRLCWIPYCRRRWAARWPPEIGLMESSSASLTAPFFKTCDRWNEFTFMEIELLLLFHFWPFAHIGTINFIISLNWHKHGASRFWKILSQLPKGSRWTCQQRGADLYPSRGWMSFTYSYPVTLSNTEKTTH